MPAPHRSIVSRTAGRALTGIVLLAVVLGGPARAAEDPPAAPRVFVCAHSFMIFTAAMLPQLAATAPAAPFESAGKQMIGGSNVLQHWNLPEAKNPAKAALTEGRVDVLTLSPFTLMPDPGIDRFTKLGLEHNPALRVLIQASWPAFDREIAKLATAKSDPPDRDVATRESLLAMQAQQNAGWRRQLEAQVRSINQSAGRQVATIIPVNDAVSALRIRILDGTAPGLTRQTDLFADAIGHPKPALALLVAYCHFAAIYQRTPVGLPIPARTAVPRPAELVPVLQQIAWEAVSAYRDPLAKP